MDSDRSSKRRAEHRGWNRTARSLRTEAVSKEETQQLRQNWHCVKFGVMVLV